MSEVIYISNAVCSFPNIAEPQRQKDEAGNTRVAYNMDVLVNPDDPALKLFMRRLGDMALVEWKENAQAAMSMIQADRKQRCYGAGEEKKKATTFQVYEGYAGKVYISASLTHVVNPQGVIIKGKDRKPQMVDAQGNPIDSENSMVWMPLARKIYGGCKVNVAVKPWVQKNAKGNGFRCDLVAVQFAGDGKPFGEGSSDIAPGMFGAVAQPTAAPAFLGAGAPAAMPMRCRVG